MGLNFGNYIRDIPPVILDTDLSTDADDATDLIFIAHMHLHHKIDLLAVGTSTSNNWAPGCADTILTHMGLNIPIGTWKGGTLSDESRFNDDVYNRFPHPHVNLAATAPDMIELYHDILEARQTNDVTIIATGWMTAINELLETYPSLVAAKVRRLIIVAGNNNGTLEPNMDGDRQAAHDVAANWPTELIQVPCTIGTALGDAGGGLDQYCPADVALIADNNWTTGRPPWAPPAFDYAAGNESYYTLTAGTLSVNATTGIDTFTVGAGPHKLLSLNGSGHVARYNTIYYEHGHGSGPYNPSNFLSAWYDPSDASTVNASGSTLTSLNDKSGNGHHLSSTNHTKPETGTRTQNGLNVIDFPGSFDSQIYVTGINKTQPYTVLFVAKYDSGIGKIFDGSAITTDRGLIDNDGPSGVWRIYAGTILNSGTTANTNVHQFSIEFNGATSKLFLDGAEIASGAAGSQTLGGLYLGGSDTTLIRFDGFIGEFLIQNYVNTGFRQWDEAYLKNKWGTP